ncbi:hypothetical protein BH10BAC5_BH10BAC5_00050 [soil metagenome]
MNNNINLSRDLLLKFIESDDYLASINSILKIVNASVSENETRMPDPPSTLKEADNNAIADMLSLYLGMDPASCWWKNILKKYSSQSWDFISTCTIDGEKGLLLVEAKAKRGEIKIVPSSKNYQSYSDVSYDIKKHEPLVNLNANRCPQLTKHIANSWTMARQDLPVILLYLGFRVKTGTRVFKRHFDWKRYLINCTRHIGSQRLIDKKIKVGKASFSFLCGSVEFGYQLPKKNVPVSKIKNKKQTFFRPKAEEVSDVFDPLLGKKYFLKDKDSVLRAKFFRKKIRKKVANKRKYTKPLIRKNKPIVPTEIINHFETYITSHQQGSKQI